jgi:hypothetical protein
MRARGDVGKNPTHILAEDSLVVAQQWSQVRQRTTIDGNLGLRVSAGYNMADSSQCRLLVCRGNKRQHATEYEDTWNRQSEQTQH